MAFLSFDLTLCKIKPSSLIILNHVFQNTTLTNTLPDSVQQLQAAVTSYISDVLWLLIILCISVWVTPVWRRSIFGNGNISDSRAEGIKLKSLCSIVWRVVLIISWISLEKVKYCSLNSLAHKKLDSLENKYLCKLIQSNCFNKIYFIYLFWQCLVWMYGHMLQQL